MNTLIKNCEGFLWDEVNSEKNWIKHKISRLEYEEIFFNYNYFMNAVSLRLQYLYICSIIPIKIGIRSIVPMGLAENA